MSPDLLALHERFLRLHTEDRRRIASLCRRARRLSLAAVETPWPPVSRNLARMGARHAMNVIEAIPLLKAKRRTK